MEITKTLQVEGTFGYSEDDVEKLYQTVFATPNFDNFFLSHQWISNWLSCAKRKPELVTFMANDRIVGFVFIGHQSSLLGNTFYLNQTGEHDDDQIWIEYNDIICASHQQQCRLALLEFIARKPKSFQFIGINQTLASWQSPLWRDWSVQAMHSYATRLDAQKTVGHDFSKNTKSQISRSRRFIEQEYGDISHVWINTNEIESALAHIAELHIKQWGSHSYGSGFSNARFVEFHTNMLRQGICEFSHIAKFSAGEHLLGYLYFFTYGKKVYFYLSAINYSSASNKYKPGLLMHKIAMEHFLEQGFEAYDFLAGQARYKTSLSNNEYFLYNVKLYTNKWYYSSLMLAVRAKRYLKLKAFRK